ncbi:MAG: phosphoglycerate kinase [Candidatus Saccharimonadales bacterium]
MFNKKTIKDVSVSGKIVLVRTDYNVPLEGDAIGDLRIIASLPTINYLLANGARKIVLMSHLGRPDGKNVPELSLAPVAGRLRELLPEAAIGFVPETTGKAVSQAVEDLPEGGILLLENLRFSPDEEANSEKFAQNIVSSTHAELFVQDGFAVVHRAHASTDAITRLLPSVAGLLLEKEATELTSAVANPEHPLLVIIGGAKVADKQPMIDTFLGLADDIAVGGKIAADGYEATNPDVYVAMDFVEDSAGAKLDIGAESTAKILELIDGAKTIIWNGLLGKAEDPEYAKSSIAVAEALGSHSDKKTIIGGGDTAEFVEGLVETNPSLTYSLISTGGGASLELLSGKKLPGIEALEDK